ncbi:MAG: hypothetical protein HN742_21730 [Lentisphaerae bacterium]|jgi:type IV/VI secretion system ImpK/VasF family protein|nr:hypothetical protein [Lentisphaerota bacterium]MBT4817995.1 hypothetical protein [Lentisphaerota bacterium]MBT5607083.1 hypothetical protein [Lentisphaerota bacterium]MBT7057190.1 hypothetical protein [Lentisphaerota bacterium]MBT7844513.1 hypothetical protein [Lentisphaerota bacterium]
MTLLELCNPLFLQVCFLSRSARSGGTMTYSRVRADIEDLFADMRSKAAKERLLEAQYQAVELPLIFFVDATISELDWAQAREWQDNRLAYDHGQLAGDERFFDLLEETLEDRSRDAAERLAVFYTCLGLGFTGIYDGRLDELQRKMMQVADRIREFTDADMLAKICPDAYQDVDTRDLIQPPGMSYLGMGIALVGLLVVVFVSVFVLFRQASHDLTQSLDEVMSHRVHEEVQGAGEGETSGVNEPSPGEDRSERGKSTPGERSESNPKTVGSHD